MTVRYGGKCVSCCIPAGEATLDYLEELEWSDEDVIVESSREPSQQRSEPMQTDEVERPREPSTTRRGEGTPKRSDSSDEEKTSVMTNFANEADVTALSKDDDEVTYVSAEETADRMSRTPSPASASKRSRGESPASREHSAEDTAGPSEYRRHSADTSDLTPPHQRSSSFAERLKKSIESAPSYSALD